MKKEIRPFHRSGFAPSALGHVDGPLLRVATYNIHKGVRGLGPGRRLEIHNLELGVASLDADLICLQEVHLYSHREARRFDHVTKGWPKEGQADFLAPVGYSSAYRTNAVTSHGEHGNALLSRWPLGEIGHQDVSDHRFEQRGLLHVPVMWHDKPVHAVVVHLGLIHSSRMRQVERLAQFIAAEIPTDEVVLVAGDFNDWNEKLDQPMRDIGLTRAISPIGGAARRLTFPSRVPVFAIDRVYTRGLRCVSTMVPRGISWARMSDHLPLVVELQRE
jgi:endonuclease/exonuclease/phosphatase family metal-dependent hydrolase